MSDKIINKTLSDKIREKAGHRIPEEFDFSSIGKIDLHEAEKIANEEIVFLSEDDLIDGLEDFELIPVKSASKNVSFVTEKTEIEEISAPSNIEHAASGEPVIDEILFEDFRVEKDLISDNEHELTVEIDTISPVDTEREKEPLSETVDYSETGNGKDGEILLSDSDEFMIAEDTDVIELDLDEMMSTRMNQETKDESEFLKQRIDEDDFDSKLDDIIKSEKSDDEFENIPGIYDDPSLGLNIRFIDDSHVGKKNRDSGPVFESDPLTENLVRMVEVSDGKLVIIDEIAESHERIEYILDDSRTYDAESLALLFNEERFMDDSDFDFIDNAIVRDDYTVYIQEIDDYLKSREALSGSEVYEILGLLPEEIEDIDEKLFGDYYKKFDDEYELEFISPELSFFNRGFVKKKDLSYFVNKEFTFFEDEKKSIEDDITSESAIIFEEDVAEIKKLLAESLLDQQDVPPDDIMSDVLEIREIVETDEIAKPDETFEGDETSSVDSVEVIDITDRIIILEDRGEIERITSDFPEKHDELVKLLSYLDGLLEKLPEETIRKFAESEYFDLYAKVLKETGK